jgi:cytoskeleton protein RodZ
LTLEGSAATPVTTTEIAEAPVARAAAADELTGDLFPTPIGMRLRAAREARGLSVEELARSTHISSAVLHDIEADRLERLGAPIYVRGYLRSYARAVGVPEVVVEQLPTPSAEPPQPVLVPSQSRPRSRYLAERYTHLLGYALLTLVVLVPVLLSVRPQSNRAVSAPELNTLDLSPAEVRVPAPANTSVTELDVASVPADAPHALAAGPAQQEMAPDPESVSATPAPEATTEPERPLMASMAIRPETIDRSAAQRVVLTLAESSWVEFTGVNGQRIEYALLPAGTVREYQVAGRADLRIGNARGAELSVDGQAVDIKSIARSNVARVKLGVPPGQ